MARGWESKSVESQVEDRRAERDSRRAAHEDPADAERERKRHTLELSRTRVLHDLETAQTEVHRAALKNALDYLDAELAKLSR